MSHISTKRDFGEEGFAEHYDARIRPKLAELEAMRRKWQRIWLATLVLGGAVLVGAVLINAAALLAKDFELFIFRSIFVGVVFGLMFMSRRKLKKEFMLAIKKEYFTSRDLTRAVWIGAVLFGAALLSNDRVFRLSVLLFIYVGAVLGTALMYREKLKKALMPTICDFFKDNKLQYHTFQEEKIRRDRGVPVRGAREVAGKLYSYTNLTVDDSFTGTHLGYDFLIDEVKITRTTSTGKNKHTVTLFSGLVLGVAGNRLFADDVLICRNGKTPNGGEFRRVLLEDVQFEKEYDAFGTDQIAARRLLEPRKMELIMAAARRISSSNTPEFMFLKNEFFLFVPSDKNHFEFEGITTSVYEIEAIKKVLTDIRVVLRLIEILLEEKILPEKANSGLL